MARTSSAKKIARLAEKGKGKKVRFQGGSVFPSVVLGVLVIGAVLIAYARQGGTVVDASVSAEQKYATAFAFFNCDALATDLKQADAATLNATDKFAAVTTENPSAIIGDGIVGWMPQVLAGQRKAKLETIFALYGMTVTDDSITLADGTKISEADTKCAEQDAVINVNVWESGSASSQLSIASFGGVKIDDQMTVVLSFAPEGTEITRPAVADSLADYQG
ncbi:MAG: hypothetical protein EBR53_01460 [Actinobacteria bacterium]|nr:hypothetical protein [Actinomycetota bacterium]